MSRLGAPTFFSRSSTRSFRSSGSTVSKDNTEYKNGTESASTSDAAESDEYTNPLDAGPRWMLTARAVAIRTTASLCSSVFGWFYPPKRVLWLDTPVLLRGGGGREPVIKGKIEVSIWGGGGAGEREERKPAVIDFHGGGFFMGLATDDALWTTTVARELDAVVFSVSYRLAPACSFPIPVEDCADAILQIAARADEFGIDPARIILSGFSAGGNLCLSSWALLRSPETWGYDILSPVPPIAGFAIFYPALDYTISRPRKRLSCSRPDLTMPQFVTDIIDSSYLYPLMSREAKADVRLSPGLMDDRLLAMLPPVHLCLCEYDMLLVEGEVFAERLRDQGKLAMLRVVAKETHAWDKPPPIAPKESTLLEYAQAVVSMKRALDMQGGGDEDEGERE